MNKKNILLIISLCLFITLFANESVAVKFDENTDKITSFTLKENPNGLVVDAGNLFFGTHDVTTNEIRHGADDDMLVSVIDTRGTKEGWKLKLKFDNFKDGTKTIEGAQLFFPQVIPETVTDGEAKNHPPISESGDTAFVNQVPGKIITVNGSNNTIATAANGTGFGEWYFPYENDRRVQLKIPGDQKSGSYTATLIYSFESVP